ncbi:MAG TPA: DUF6600 domain-containing protein, partial [Stellaceae bacterium]|nr:DUF6600 domain-containing protein [Stellaceae bacterium]
MRSLLHRLSFAVLSAAAPFAAQAGAPNMAPIPPAAVAAPLPASPSAPTRVGRVSLVLGKVGFRAAGASDWSAAAPNFPVAAGEALRTDTQSRVALEIGPQTLDLAPGSELRIAGLDRQRIELVLQGRLYLHLRPRDAGETIAIALPQGGVQVSAPGEYDIDSGGPNQPARISAFTGSARFAGTVIASGHTAALAAAKPALATQGPAAADAFDAWSRLQDYQQAKLASPYYISPEMTGYAALDGHGNWEKSAEYGEVWYPDGLPANWAPYRYGHWQRIAPWGWTWIDDQPWGFAPSHYGRWALIGKRWGWVPGRFVEDPAYVPAVVAFLGTPGVGVSVAGSSTPAIGWFPLAPGEVYWPSYSRNLDYVRDLNKGDLDDPAAVALEPDGNPPVEITVGQFANRRMASVVPRPDFVAGHPVAPALLQLPLERLVDAPVITGSPRLGPAPAPRPTVAAG